MNRSIFLVIFFLIVHFTKHSFAACVNGKLLPASDGTSEGYCMCIRDNMTVCKGDTGCVAASGTVSSLGYGTRLLSWRRLVSFYDPLRCKGCRCELDSESSSPSSSAAHQYRQFTSPALPELHKSGGLDPGGGAHGGASALNFLLLPFVSSFKYTERDRQTDMRAHIHTRTHKHTHTHTYTYALFLPLSLSFSPYLL